MNIRNFGSRNWIAIAIALLIVIWSSVFGSIIVLQPDMMKKTMIIAAGAAATELLVYAGAAFFGVSLYKLLRSKLGLGGKRG